MPSSRAPAPRRAAGSRPARAGSAHGRRTSPACDTASGAPTTAAAPAAAPALAEGDPDRHPLRRVVPLAAPRGQHPAADLERRPRAVGADRRGRHRPQPEVLGHQVHLEVAQHTRVDQDGRGVLVGTRSMAERWPGDRRRQESVRWQDQDAVAHDAGGGPGGDLLGVPATPRAGRRRTTPARVRRPRRQGSPAGRRPEEGQAPDLAADLRRELRGQGASPRPSTCRSTAGAATAPRPTTGRSAAATTDRTGTSTTSRTAGPRRSTTASAARTTAPRTPRCSRTEPRRPRRC